MNQAAAPATRTPAASHLNCGALPGKVEGVVTAPDAVPVDPAEVAAVTQLVKVLPEPEPAPKVYVADEAEVVPVGVTLA